jgi:hypothetical protein
VVGFVGCIIYAAEFHRVYVFQFSVGQLYWGFGLVAIALSLTGIFACVMFAFNRNQHLRVRGPTLRREPGQVGFAGVSVVLGRGGGSGEEPEVYIPYYGKVSASQLGQGGASPMQPPSYDDTVLSGSAGGPSRGDVAAPAYTETANEIQQGPQQGLHNYTTPPADVTEAPPSYDDVTKDLDSLPTEAVAHLGLRDKDDNSEQQPPPPLPPQQ